MTNENDGGNNQKTLSEQSPLKNGINGAFVNMVIKPGGNNRNEPIYQSRRDTFT